MRALGITKLGMILLYVYEAFVLVFSSSLLGLAIGYNFNNTDINYNKLKRDYSWIYNDNAKSIIYLIANNICFSNSEFPRYIIHQYTCCDIKHINSFLFYS